MYTDENNNNTSMNSESPSLNSNNSSNKSYNPYSNFTKSSSKPYSNFTKSTNTKKKDNSTYFPPPGGYSNFQNLSYSLLHLVNLITKCHPLNKRSKSQ
eukprot:UN04607